MSEGDRGIVPARQDEVSQAAVGHIKETAIAKARTRE
jgi:hypothetical protein